MNREVILLENGYQSLARYHNGHHTYGIFSMENCRLQPGRSGPVLDEDAMRNSSSFLCGLCVVILALAAPAAQQTQFRIASLILVGSSALPNGQLESTYRVQVQNLGPDASIVTATVTNGRGHANLVVVDGALTFGAIAAGQVATSVDTFTA